MPLDPTLGELSDQQLMTHYAPQPNPAAPYLDAARKFYSGGLTEASPAIRQAMPDWLNNLGSLFQEQAARDAFSTANVGPSLEIMAGPRGYTEMMGRGGPLNPGMRALGDLGVAKQMETQGYGRGDIRQKTEWYKEHPSDIWNKEIYDNPSTLNVWEIPRNSFYLTNETQVGAVLNHDALYNVYPHLKKLPLAFVNDPVAAITGHQAGFIPPNYDFPNGAIVINNAHMKSLEQIKSSILHELQHAADVYEGRKLRTGSINREEYLKRDEEARARNTQFRAKHTPEQLKTMDPWTTMLQMENPVKETDVTLPP